MSVTNALIEEACLQAVTCLLDYQSSVIAEKQRALEKKEDEMLKQWLAVLSMSKTDMDRDAMLATMPDPRKAARRAYLKSFGERNWEEVVKYCQMLIGF